MPVPTLQSLCLDKAYASLPVNNFSQFGSVAEEYKRLPSDLLCKFVLKVLMDKMKPRVELLQLFANTSLTQINLKRYKQLTNEQLKRISLQFPCLHSIKTASDLISSFDRCSFSHLQFFFFVRSAIPIEGLKQLVHLAPKLQELKFLKGRSIDFEGCAFDNLEKLSVSGCDETVDVRLASAPKLKELNIIYCKTTPFTVSRLDSIEKIDLSYCQSIDNDNMVLLSKSAPNLKILDVRWTRITNFTGCSFEKLEWINLWKCSYLIDDCFENLAIVAPNLKEIRGLTMHEKRESISTLFGKLKI